MAYCTLDDIKRYLGIDNAVDDTTATDDALLMQLRARAQGMIDRWCDQTFEALSDSTRNFDTELNTDGDWLIFDKPLCAITSITNGDGSAVSSSNYVTEPRNDTPYWGIKLKSSSSIAWEYDSNDDPEDAIAVVGRWAYSTTAPATVQQACVRLISYLYHQKDNAGDLDRPVVVGEATLLPSTLPEDITKMLNPYKRVGIG